ncbi:MAG: BrnT family toxin [Candidatus Eisenbacteria bacterium]|uniref:BrnT family toxin n=1 Tax=Eiseniibacteriota bacterium TaxID=2212470 RepID=A0A7Y2H3K3_UNCEI|nr:BrnT family toxin [Candidatus Eisenbacteria bacterium]
MLELEWDPAKAEVNVRKHGVSFLEAQSVFFDERALEFYDPDHSTNEDRFLILGRSYRLRVLVVCHCLRESEDVIRIISARKANPRERTVYSRNR